MGYTTGPFQYTQMLSSLGTYILYGIGTVVCNAHCVCALVSTHDAGHLGVHRYVVRMTDVKISGKSIGVAPTVYSRNSMGGCVIDSGTNILLLPAPAYKGVQTLLTDLLCPGFSVPVWRTNKWLIDWLIG
jgi:hypothetical protein